MLLNTLNLTIQIAKKAICNKLTLSADSGDIWGILGPNGCGKTTLLQTLAGLTNPNYGEIFIKSKNLHTLSTKNRARELGILLQDTAFVFPQNVFEYCLTGRYPHLHGLAWEKSNDYETVSTSLKIMELENLLQQNVFTLSGGERRRLAIATLLAQTPSLYLLDEPTNHLDLRHQVIVLNHFKKLASENVNAVLMSLHDVNLAQQYCNKVLLLFGDGETLQGNTEDVLTQENLSRLYQHPLQAIFQNHKKPFWAPAYER